jgi:tetratricopeptide (TPR) repeat protein
MTHRALLILALAAGTALSPLPALAADGAAGSYLAARHASLDNDYAEAARYYSRALVRDPRNPVLLENAVSAYLGTGDVDKAVPVARRLVQLGENNQVANLALIVDNVAKGEWEEILTDLEAGQTVGQLYDNLIRAWSLVGAGRMSEALVQLDEIAEAPGVQAFGIYHKALALASVGDFEGANDVLTGDETPRIALTRRGVIAHAEILSQIDRHDEALKLIDTAFGPGLDPQIQELNDRLAAGEAVPFSIVNTPRDGIAEVHFSIAGALNGEAADSYTLIYARLTEHLRPDHVDGLLLTADMLERLERYELAVEVYDKVPRDAAVYHAAELGRAGALEQLDRIEAAVEVLTQLAESHGHLPTVHTSLGDLFRRAERYDEAIAPYSRAVDLIGEPQASHWGVFFSRGIAYEREDMWDRAESDFRLALELNPDQPQVLNYLGYSLVEKQEKLDEALDMIERAVEGQPNSGYITDSLGWVLYRLGRYEEAVGHMERAVELMPVDPIITDHLGDVYWAVGRYREAEFQWHRALSFDPEKEDADRIRRKLEVGLDVVLEEEGAPPLRVANDG